LYEFVQPLSEFVRNSFIEKNWFFYVRRWDNVTIAPHHLSDTHLKFFFMQILSTLFIRIRIRIRFRQKVIIRVLQKKAQTNKKKYCCIFIFA